MPSLLRLRRFRLAWLRWSDLLPVEFLWSFLPATRADRIRLVRDGRDAVGLRVIMRLRLRHNIEALMCLQFERWYDICAIACLHERTMDARTKRAWTGLVNYANGNETGAEIGSTVAACMGWVSAVAPFGLFDWIGTTDLTAQAEQYRSGVDILLRFLCSRPKSAERTSLRSSAQNFIFEHGQHIGALHITEIVYNERVDKSLGNFGYAPSERQAFKE